MRLLLMRHAEAAVGGARPDHERPLTARGRRDAAAMGRWLRRSGSVPEAVWCSSARRARETWQGVAATLGESPEVQFLRAVYDAGPPDLLDLLAEVPSEVETVLMLGHNPTMQHLVAALTGETRGFPAGAVAVVDLTGDWAAPGDGKLVDLVAPQDT